MDRSELITLETLCDQYQLEMSFFSALDENDLIHVVSVEQTRCVHQENLADIEKIVRLHQDLDINIAGIDAVLNLLNRLEALQSELNRVRNRLRLYE